MRLPNKTGVAPAVGGARLGVVRAVAGVAASIALALTVSRMFAAGGPGQDMTQYVLAGLQNRQDGIQSLNGEFVTESYYNERNIPKGSAGAPPSRELERSRLWMQGESWAAELVYVLPAAAGGRHLSSWDGVHQRVSTPGSRTISKIGLAPSVAPPDDFFLDLTKRGAGRALSGMIATYGAQYAATEVLAGVRTYRMEADRFGRRHYWWVAPERGFALIRYLTDRPRRYSTRLWDTDRRAWIADRLQECPGGVWMPVAVRDVVLGLRTGQPEGWSSVTRWRAVSLTVNEPLPPAVCRWIVPLGDFVVSDGGERSFVGGDTSAVTAYMQSRQALPQALLTQLPSDEAADFLPIR